MTNSGEALSLDNIIMERLIDVEHFYEVERISSKTSIFKFVDEHQFVKDSG
jgi:hypothetical protein